MITTCAETLTIPAPLCGCKHLVADHLLYLGPVRLCMEAGCACGRRRIARIARATAPWWPVLTAAAYLAWHMALWASRGFLVVGP